MFLRLAVILAFSLPFSAASHAQSIEMVPLDAPNILDTNQQSAQTPDEEEMGEETVFRADDTPQAVDASMEVFPAVRLRALDKITARISTVEAPVGAARFYGTLEITINRCAFHPPEEPPENAAFITVRDRGYDGLTPKQIFSGWIFSSSPAISALEHPVYDLTLLACFAD